MTFAARLSAVALGIALSATSAGAETALAAVAANYAGAAEALAEQFRAETGHEVQITTGATGKLYAQIREGAPFDLMLSADAKTPAQLETDGAAIPGSRFTYAVGKLALWAPGGGLPEADPAAALDAPGVLFVAIANPDLAPYGLAAQQALEALGKWDNLQGKIVKGENIGQTFSMAESGAAQLGFVALSALVAPDKPARGAHWVVPQDLYQPIRQDAVLLTHGAGNPAAEGFLEFLKSDAAKSVATEFGYGTD